jgi:gas vesicle protein
MKSQTKQVAKAVGAAVAGVTMGYVAGVLTAPAKGTETRERIGRKVGESAADFKAKARKSALQAKAGITQGAQQAKASITRAARAAYRVPETTPDTPSSF